MSKNNESEPVVDVTLKTVKKNSKLERIEAKLARVRSSIKEAALVRNLTSTHQDLDYVPHGPVYRNANAFHRYTPKWRPICIYLLQIHNL